MRNELEEMSTSFFFNKNQKLSKYFAIRRLLSSDGDVMAGPKFILFFFVTKSQSKKNLNMNFVV